MNGFVLKVDTPQANILVLADRFSKDVVATIDGKQVELYRANHLFMGVVVPAGTHDVEVMYRPERGSLYLFEAGGFVWFAALGVSLFRRKPENEVAP